MIQNSQNELNEALKNNGVDSQLLKSISDEVERFKILLENIEKHKYFVENYLKEYRDKIANIPALKQKLQNDEKYLNDLKEKKKQHKKEFKEKELELESKKKILFAKQNNITNFTKAYSEKIETQKIAKAIKSSLKLGNYELDESMEISSTIVDGILKLFDDIKICKTP